MKQIFSLDKNIPVALYGAATHSIKAVKRLYRFFIPSSVREKIWNIKSSVTSRAEKLYLFVFNKKQYSRKYEKPISLGKENPGKTFCVIGYENDKFSSEQGVLSTWQAFSKQIVYALQKGYIPVVDLLNNYRPMLLDSYNKGRLNAWDLYFKQPQHDFPIESILKSKRVIFGNKGISLSKNFIWSNLPLSSLDCSVGQLLVLSSPLSDEISDSVEEFVSGHFLDGDKVLGVSFRRSFERHHYFNSSLTPSGTHLVRATLESLMQKIDKILKTKQFTRIFLSVDDREAHDIMVERYSDRCFYIKRPLVHHFHNGAPIPLDNKADVLVEFNKRKDDIVLKGKEYLTEVGILAKCHGFLSAGGTADLYAYLLNNNKYEYFEQLGR